MSSFRVSRLFKEVGLGPHAAIGQWLRLGLIGQCVATTLLSAVLLITASTLDDTWFLEGINVGLFEHPTVWTLLALQLFLPMSVAYSYRKAMQESGLSRSEWTKLEDIWRMRDNWTRVAGALFFLTGFCAFAWNSYQNQLPGISVPFDFWDSSNYPFGYWITRVYKFYLYVWLFPYIALLHFSLLTLILRNVRRKREADQLALNIFHGDGVGGLGYIPALITRPIGIALAVASIPLASAFLVHDAFDITPAMGLFIVVGGALLAYIVPIFTLRVDLIELKKAELSKLRDVQEANYNRVLESDATNIEVLRDSNDALDYFDKIAQRVEKISNYPHFVLLMRYIGLAALPSIVSISIKLFQVVRPVIQSV